MSGRSRARQVALQSLYQLDAGGMVEPDEARREAIRRFHRGRLRSSPLVEFADALVDGVLRHRVSLDALLEARSENWRLSRIAPTDRAVRRIAAFELFHTSAPPAVVADEAIDLARLFGGEASPRFVAGILGRIVADRPGPEQAGADRSPQEA